jgi:hypothetical protein
VSEHIETVNARYVVVDGTAQPGTYEFADGEVNEVSCIRFRSPMNQQTYVLEGRPEDVLSTLRLALAVAEENLMQTVRSPELRRMYGDMAESSQGGTAPMDADVCYRERQHVRSTRHARVDCP